MAKRKRKVKRRTAIIRKSKKPVSIFEKIFPQKEWRLFMPLDELIEKEAKRFAKEAAKTVKFAMKIGKQMMEIFIDEMSKDIKDEIKGKKKEEIREEKREEEHPTIPIQ